LYLKTVTRIAEHTALGAPLCAFATCIHPTEPVLLRRLGWSIGDDIHDAFEDSLSYDNGATWEAARPSLARIDEDGGHIVFVEHAMYYDAEKDRAVHLTNQLFQPSLTGANLNHSPRVRITTASSADFARGEAKPDLIDDFGLKQGLQVSFCHPVQDSRGRLLVPVEWQAEDKNSEISSQGFPVRQDLPAVLQDVWETALLIGTYDSDGKLNWERGQPVPYDFQTTSRGLCEGTVTELADGRLAMVLRGSNAAWPHKPGYKWVSFSSDGGMSWTQAEPWACDDGSLLQSSATGSLLLRSRFNDKLYWIGNLCLNGESAQGNMPRAPLVIAEVQEEPFALRRETITVIGKREAHEDELVQLSNFQCYQDRITGDIVLYLTRFGERGSANGDWLKADLYEFRIGLGD
jgi:hypothetical protein